MAITKVFQSSNSQAVRIPRQFQFDDAEVEMSGTARRLSRTPARNLSAAFAALTYMPADFFAESRQATPPQTREGL